MIFLAALNVILKKGKNEIYNVGSDISYTNFKIVNTICKYLKLNTKHYIEFVDDRPYNDSRYAIDYKKIKKLNWNNKYSLISDFPSLIDWYLKNLSRK